MQASGPIRIAALGSDTTTSELMRAANQLPAFNVVHRFHHDSMDPTEGLQEADQNWEQLLDDSFVDLVVVAHEPSESTPRKRRSEQLKRLVQTGVPLVLVHPACDMLLAYELEMNRVESGGPIFPYTQAVDHPAIEALLKESNLNDVDDSIEQWIVERLVPADQRDRFAVMQHVARDALIVSRLLGDISSVSATGVDDSSSRWGSLNVHYAGPTPTIARWSIAPEQHESGIRVTRVGPGSRSWVWIPASAANVTMSEPLLTMDPNWSASTAFLQRVAATLLEGASWIGADWDQTCRSLEVSDAVERSIRRKRTIELYHEQITEQETFKSMMAAGGCGMLLWVMTLLMIAGLVEGLQLPLRNSWAWRLWPIFLLAPPALFLGLQFLQFAFPKKSTP